MTSQSDSSPTAQDLWRDDPERWLSSHDSGVLSLSVGPTGNLATFHLAPQWYRTLSVAEFGDAVLRAKRESNGLRVRELEEPQGAPNGGSPTHDLASALARNFNDSQKQAEDLSRNMANLHGFPHGSWPSATIY